MSLQFDARHQAMLAEMGVPLWWQSPERPGDAPMAPAVTPADKPAIQPAVQLARPPAEPRPAPPPRAAKAPADSPERPAALLPLDPDIASLDSAQLLDSVARCQACAMCIGRQASVMMPVLAQADWLVVGEPPDDAQEQAGAPFVGEAGRLLDNMLRAVGAARLGTEASGLAQRAYLSLAMKCRPARPSVPDAQALADCAQYLKREIALVRPKVMLAMGRVAMRLLLSQESAEVLRLPLGKLRARLWHYEGVPVVVTYPPAYLLRSPQDKARAWQDLCLALDVVQGRKPGH